MSDERAVVMVVDGNDANLKVAKNALSQSFYVFTVPSAVKMFDMQEHNSPNVILLDIAMTEMDGFEAIKTLKSRQCLQDIPDIFLTARGDLGSELECLALGTIDYISKPFTPLLLHKRVDLQLTVETKSANCKNRPRYLKNMFLRQKNSRRTHNPIEVRSSNEGKI